ncbi:pyridine nucleotide transhydrogenase [Paraburkholderia monticola]|uniref:Pyridine nucleotide transhydrogenase n=1 Tax=Paraburkholderia monticola TaxID=1399968 RepID=A0A149Q0Y7_9BURK|nr:NAD(P)-dependent oxidoreductase [Paraburkholderia monticola]KXU90939.1 pyridine nucleotide transhydrogenase [Paraburkholderia monticola]
MDNALIGYTGFVGSTLHRQRDYGAVYRSTNIDEIDGKTFGRVACAAAPGQKWIANRDPLGDQQRIDGLIAHLETIRCDEFVLLSTVDVFLTPVGVDETSPVVEDGLHAYGLNRRRLEKFVEAYFPKHLIVRLPGLVGPGLRKNVLFDFLNDNNVHLIDSRGSFQFYPMVNLSYDIDRALAAGLRLVHLTAEPITVSKASSEGFGKPFEQHVGDRAASYDMRSLHASLFGGTGHYQYSARETLQAVRSYAQTEQRTLPAPTGAHT